MIENNGFKEWGEIDYKKYDLPDLNGKELNLDEIYNELSDSILKSLPNNGESEFDNTSINEILDILLIKNKDDFNFNEGGKYYYNNLSSFLNTVIQTTKKNEILNDVVKICYLEKIDLLEDYPQENIEKLLTYAYVLNNVVNTMFEDLELLKKYHESIQEEMKNGELKDWKKDLSLFGYIKIISVNNVLKTYYKKSKSYSLLYRIYSLSVNIIEAMAQDYNNDNIHNVKAGYQLALGDGLYDTTYDLPKKAKSMYEISYLPVNWVNIYESWNMCFVLDNYNSIVFWAKLLNPAVGDYYDDENIYIRPRVIGLYLHIVYYLTEKQKDGKFFTETDKIVNAKKVSKIWGKVNHLYADRYRELYEEDNKKSFKNKFHNFVIKSFWYTVKFGVIVYKLVKSVKIKLFGK